MIGVAARLLALTAIYLAVLTSLQPWDAAIGLALAGLMLFGTRAFRNESRPERRPFTLRRAAAFVPFLLAVAADMARGTWNVALVVPGIRPPGEAGIVRVPFGERSEQGVVVSAIALTLSPGSVLLDIDMERREMVIHAIDAADPERVVAELQEFYLRHQRAVFP